MCPEDEMIRCFERAGVLMRSLTFYVMKESDTSKMFDEFFALADKIRVFIKRATGKDDEEVADLAMELIQNRNMAAAFVHKNAGSIAA